MDYYIHLAEEQYKRFQEYETAHPLQSRLENRQAFFSRRYEVNISFSIVQGISENKEYNENHPVKP